MAAVNPAAPRPASPRGETTRDDLVVWKGRPSVGPYVILYGVAALLLSVALLVVEFELAGTSPIFTSSFTIGSFTIPYAVEVLTVAVVLIGYMVKLVGLAIMQARNSYELRTDGLYINRGIANLTNTFVSPMAFSDAKLVRTVGMRLVGRSLIVIETNDERRFEMKLIKDGMRVQSLIRSNLAHPTVRLERQYVVAPAA